MLEIFNVVSYLVLELVLALWMENVNLSNEVSFKKKNYKLEDNFWNRLVYRIYKWL